MTLVKYGSKEPLRLTRTQRGPKMTNYIKIQTHIARLISSLKGCSLDDAFKFWINTGKAKHFAELFGHCESALYKVVFNGLTVGTDLSVCDAVSLYWQWKIEKSSVLQSIYIYRANGQIITFN